jgi:tRNA uridine 5-carboxymethylaminomethyl modification enzyme
MFPKYDVIVVGAGHAGCEAAAAAANLGSKVLLVTMNMQTIAQMSCNPAMGGIAKGQIVREIDAMGGYSGIVSDLSTIQFKMLNLSKGPAMWSPRAQNDRMLFAGKWREMLEQTPNVDFYQDMVKSIIIKKEKACGVITGMGHEILAESVVVTSGTFLNGVIHIGEKQFGGGRVAEKAATGITEQLVECGMKSDRLKTGTPPRVDGRSLDYTKMEEQKGDEEIVGFSYLNIPRVKAENQRSCFITYTNNTVHDLLKTGFDRSPMYQGRIEGVGPRYCPSIEDKINRFADRDRHQIFVEPEGWNTVEIYVNGFSTSLRFLHKDCILQEQQKKQRMKDGKKALQGLTKEEKDKIKEDKKQLQKEQAKQKRLENKDKPTKSKKEEMFDRQLESYQKNRDSGMPQKRQAPNGGRI